MIVKYLVASINSRSGPVLVAWSTVQIVVIISDIRSPLFWRLINVSNIFVRDYFNVFLNIKYFKK